MKSPIYAHEVLPVVPVIAPRIERRMHPRFSFCATAEAVDVRSRSVLKARVSDIGRGGCYVDAFSPFPTETPVQLRITSNKKSFEATAQVANAQMGMGMGLKFCAVESGQQHVLDSWLAELGNEKPVEWEREEVTVPKAEAQTEIVKEAVAVAQAKKQASVSGEQWLVLNELVIALMRKKVLTPHEGQAMLKNLFEGQIAQ